MKPVPEHGDWVSCEIEAENHWVKIELGRITIADSIYVCQNLVGKDYNDMEYWGFKRAWGWTIGSDPIYVRNLVILPFGPGDTIVDPDDGKKAKVLTVLGPAFLKSLWSNHQSAGNWHHFDEAKKWGWKLYVPESKLEKAVKCLAKLSKDSTKPRDDLEAARMSRASWLARPEYAEAGPDKCALCDLYYKKYCVECPANKGFTKWGCMKRALQIASGNSVEWMHEDTYHRDSMIEGLNRVIKEILEDMDR